MTRYDTPNMGTTGTAGGMAGGRDAGLEVNTAVVTPTDRIRWGPILAGVFAAITAMAVLSVLGAAVGMTAYDANDSARTFAIGAGIWGAITMLLAFALGGWLTARSAAVRGKSNGLLNGAMVAAVGIPLMLFLLGSAGTLVGAGAAQQAQVPGQNTGSAFDGAVQAAATIGDGDGAQAGQAQSPQQARQAEEAAEVGSRTAWGTLVALLLAIAAAAVGGYLGARDRDHDRAHAGHGATA